jgi:FMN reductase
MKLVVPTAVYAASEDWGAQGLPERIERAAGELAALMTGLTGGAGRAGAGRVRGRAVRGTAGGAVTGRPTVRAE